MMENEKENEKDLDGRHGCIVLIVILAAVGIWYGYRGCQERTHQRQAAEAKQKVIEQHSAILADVHKKVGGHDAILANIATLEKAGILDDAARQVYAEVMIEDGKALNEKREYRAALAAFENAKSKLGSLAPPGSLAEGMKIAQNGIKMLDAATYLGAAKAALKTRCKNYDADDGTFKMLLDTRDFAEDKKETDKVLLALENCLNVAAGKYFSEKRKKLAKENIENMFIKMGIEATVRAKGKDAKTLDINYPLCSRVFLDRLLNGSGNYDSEMGSKMFRTVVKSAGFTKITCDTGYEGGFGVILE